MIDLLKTLTVRVIAGANVGTVIIMLVVGFSYNVNPASHPLLACAGMVFPVLLVINTLFLLFWLVFKWRMIFIPVGGFLLAYVPVSIYMPLHLPSDMPEDAVKVLSFNVQYYSGKPRYDGAGDMIVDYIRDSGAGIVCLQEDVPDNNVKRRLDSLYRYSDNTHLGTRYSNGLGIYTNYRILKKERIPYESEGNGSVAYFLKMDGDTVIVVNNHFESTHLSLDDRRMYKDMLKGEVEKDTVRTESKKLIHKLGEAAALRAPQAEAVHRYIDSLRHYPIIVCGDFNDSPISYTRHVVAQGLTDCFAATGRGIGLTYNQKGFFVRIDNIMCSDHFTPYNCKVDSKIDASDHYPIYCWLKMRDKP